MIRVIDGKRYNTETADKIADWDNGCYTSDFGYYDEELYRTKNGAWFLVRSGGPMTCMAVSVGSNCRTGSSDLSPMSDNDALEWLQDHSGESDAVAAIEKYFADAIQDA